MKLRSCVSLLALSATVALGQTGTKSLSDADQAWETSFHAGKLEEAMSVVAPDAIILEPNMPMAQGTEKVTAALQGADVDSRDGLLVDDVACAGLGRYGLYRWSLLHLVQDAGRANRTWTRASI